MVNYNIADLVSRINNTLNIRKNIVEIPYSKDNYQILTQLGKLGIIDILNENENTLNNPHQKKRQKKSINISLKMLLPAIKNNNKEIDLNKIASELDSIKVKSILTVISTPGKRVYVGYKDLKDFNHGHKTYLIRTSKGILTSQTAIKNQIGGELLIKLSYFI